MLYVVNNSNDPYFNHAVEEYIMNNFSEEVFMLWINKPTILIGRNQNTMSEIELDYVKENDIEVVRRLSGGGAVYNDYGVMQFTFITYKNQNPLEDGFEKFARPVIEALNSLGVKAEFTGRNDILIEGKKICGNAQYSNKDKIIHHGTLLYNGDMSVIGKALKSREIKFIDKSVKSVGSRVTNIYEHMGENKMDLVDFRDYLKKYVMDSYKIESSYVFDQEEIDRIEEIAKEKFRTWEWNYGKSPDYSYENAFKYKGIGVVEYRLNIVCGKIEDISIYGDFFSEKDIAGLEERLRGVNFHIDSIESAMEGVEISQYIKGFTLDEFVKGLLDIKTI